MRTRDFTKFIFLDFDGVLVTNHRPFPGVGNPAAVEALNYITDQTGAAIVVSSTWRLDGLMRCRENLAKWGVTGPVIDITPRLQRDTGLTIVSQPRGLEIAKWLEEWSDIGDLESFVIIDDDSDMAPNMDRLVKTSYPDGLTFTLACKAVDLLQRPVAVKITEKQTR